MNNTFSLKQIAENTNCEITIDIPALQRGLVWKAKQVEFLWDSILRGFPIGGFILSENNGNHYDLMDGQQRFNAIGLGFEEPEKSAKSILWIDIDFLGIHIGICRKLFLISLHLFNLFSTLFLILLNDLVQIHLVNMLVDHNLLDASDNGTGNPVDTHTCGQRQTKPRR